MRERPDSATTQSRQAKLEDTVTHTAIDYSGDNDQQPDPEGEYTHATLLKDHRGTFPNSFTICSSFFHEAWTTPFVGGDLISVDGLNAPSRWAYVSIWPVRTHTQYMVGIGRIYFETNDPFVYFPLQWKHVCVALDADSDTVRLVVDGKMLEEKAFKGMNEDDDNRPSNLSLLVGMKTTPVAEFTGQITNLNVFSSALSRERMERMTGGDECGAPGDYLSWQEAEWRLHSAATIQTLDRTPCGRVSQIHVFTADFVFHEECMEHCKKVGSGRSPAVRTLQELSHLQDQLALITPHPGMLGYLWLAATDSEVEGEWRDYYTSDPLEDYAKPWHAGHDDKYGPAMNCLQYDNNYNELWEWVCIAYGTYCPCAYTRPPYLSLRGLCDGHMKPLLDQVYTPQHSASDPLEILFTGQEYTFMRFSDETNQWTMTSAAHAIRAVSGASKQSYALGKHTWTISNDKLTCHQGTNYTTQLKLTGCSDGEFTCGDGRCIEMEQRCDQISHCKDKSDEEDCILMVLEKSYNRKIPPITTVSATDFSLVPVDLNISMTLMKIVGMEEVEHSIDFKFEIMLEWKDTRVVYHNLKKKESLNALTDEEISQLWLPRVIYDNTDQMESTKVGEEWGWSTGVTIAREGEFTRSQLDEVDEIEIFRGEDNTISMMQVYTHRFQCQYHLQKYPFDTQVRFLNIALLGIVSHRMMIQLKNIS